MFGGCEVMITPPGILGKAESPSGALKGGRYRQLVAPRRRNTLLCSHLGTSPVVASLVAFHTSRWRGRRPQPRDQRQDIGQHLSRHRDLGHPEGDIAPMAVMVRFECYFRVDLGATESLFVATVAWYRKSQPTFADTLAAVRRQFWQEKGFSTSYLTAEAQKSQPALHEAIAYALCHAA